MAVEAKWVVKFRKEEVKISSVLYWMVYLGSILELIDVSVYMINWPAIITFMINGLTSNCWFSYGI